MELENPPLPVDLNLCYRHLTPTYVSKAFSAKLKESHRVDSHGVDSHGLAHVDFARYESENRVFVESNPQPNVSLRDAATHARYDGSLRGRNGSVTVLISSVSAYDRGQARASSSGGDVR